MEIASEIDVAVVGAGAAGIAAARRLMASPVSFAVLEAGPRIGGRAWTVARGGWPLDLGCGWLHSADVNPWTNIAEAEGLTVDRSPPPWTRQSFDVDFPPEEQRGFRAAFAALEERLEEAAKGPDRPAAELLEPGGRWNAMLDAFSGYFNGAPFAEISVHDYGAYQDTDVNWRVVEGYGTAVAGLAAPLAVLCETPVTRIDRSGPRLLLETPRGVIEARAAIVAVPSTVLAEEGLAIHPPLPDKLEAAAALPLGHVDKAFLALDRPEPFPEDGHLWGSTTQTDVGNYHLRPFGRPVIEGFFAGELAAELEREGEGAFGRWAVEDLVRLLGSDMRTRLTPLAESRWGEDPLIRGAYSHAKPGRAGARALLAEPVEGRLFFAGEACSAGSFSTVHGASETGIAAAQAALAALGVPAR